MSSRNRRWFRFSLRTLLIVATLLCIFLAVTVKRARDRKSAISTIKALGGTYGVHIEGPVWLRNLVGDNEYFYNAGRVSFGPGNDGYDPSHPFGDDELGDVIDHINAFSRFRTLGLSSSQVTDHGLAHLVKLQNLERLRLANTQISDAGLDQLTGITTLRHIDVTRCNVSAEGAQRLRQALPKCEIQCR